jgi:hypothetical protein
VEKNAHSDSKILVVADPVYDNEVSWSIKTYLSLAGFNDLYFYPMAREYSSDSELTLRSVWEKWFEGRVIKKIEEEPNMVIVVNKSQSDLFFNSNGISKSDYENVIKDDNPRAVYMKNN